MRLLMLGLDDAGKTSILKSLNGEDLSLISPTLGFNIKTLTFPPHYKLNIWDVGGQQTIRSYWRNYYEQTDGLIFVIDSAHQRRLTEVKQELQLLLKQEKLSGASLLVFANKQDLPGALSHQQIAEALDLSSMSSDRHCHIVSCSAMSGKGLREGMQWIVKDIAARIYMMD